VQASYANGTNVEELTTLLGRGRSKKGMFEGDLIEGELEIGQVAGLFEKLQSAKEVMEELIQGYHEALKEKTTEKYNF
jgi:enoyl-[acyl-carrier protein] reductase II